MCTSAVVLTIYLGQQEDHIHHILTPRSDNKSKQVEDEGQEKGHLLTIYSTHRSVPGPQPTNQRLSQHSLRTRGRQHGKPIAKTVLAENARVIVISSYQQTAASRRSCMAGCSARTQRGWQLGQGMLVALTHAVLHPTAVAIQAGERVLH